MVVYLSPGLCIIIIVLGYVQRVLEEVFKLRAENPTYPLASGLITQRPPSLASQYAQAPQQQLIDRHQSRFNLV